MKWSFSILLLLVIVVVACQQLPQPSKQPTNSNEVQILKVVSVYDADTFRVELPDWPSYLGKTMSIRVRGIDAPEIRGQCDAEKLKAKQARDFVKAELAKAKIITLQNIEPDKYFRLLADVYVDGHLLSAQVQHQGYARSYDGSKRQSWCNI